ncbi:zinc-ribbon domain-containing protein [Caldibacillus lycopersici]|uniref:Zinc-ribbon domain-containing protein n=1 Tax=Perspicuibacillus lycopersici TaxID=1325689 RepID=A0AAE3LSJ7_9BACI|nr:zinc-ribbon domain-containing protein [Perspicuibacillus lycopersici]MCU9612808.1 zinc-ribbon domain-containing protein [Perspicuibacillus lycopersici]
MEFCKNCGSKLEEHAVFCSECGQSVEGELQQPSATVEGTTVNSATASNNVRPASSISFKSFSKKQKIITSVIAGIVIILLISFFTLKNITNPEKKLERFEEALKTEDKDALKSLLDSGDSRIKLEDKHVEGLLTYVKDNPSELDYIISNLEDQLDSLQSSKSKKASSEDSYFLNLKEDGKTFLLFDDYQIQLKPYYITVSTDYANSDVYVDGKKVGTTNEDAYTLEFGPYLPADYNFKIELASDYATLSNELEVDLYDYIYDTNEVYVDLYLDATSVDIYTDYSDAEIFVNGKSAGVSEDGYFYIDPITLDGSFTVYAEKEFPWGVVKSEEVTIEDYSYDLELNPVNDELKTQVSTAIKDYFTAYNAAYKGLDSTKIAQVNESYADQLISDIDYYKDSEYQYVGNGITSATVYLDSIGIDQYDGVTEAYVEAKVTQNGDLLYGDASEEERSEVAATDDEYVISLYLEYDETAKNWLVSYADEYYYYDTDYVEEETFTFDN